MSAFFNKSDRPHLEKRTTLNFKTLIKLASTLFPISCSLFSSPKAIRIASLQLIGGDRELICGDRADCVEKFRKEDYPLSRCLTYGDT
jgi:hypothetical protein